MVIATVLGGLTLGAVAYASGTGGGTVKACVSKHGGGLYVGRCHHHDRVLIWAKTGPIGPRGPKGPPGQQGLPGNTGAQGPSAAFTNQSTGPVAITQSLTTKTVNSLTLPAGKYIVMFRGEANLDGGSGSVEVSCSLTGFENDDVTLDDTNSPAGASEVVSLLAPIVTPGGTVAVGCYDANAVPSGAATKIISSHLAAIQVASLTGT
jgi:hypothetical protein